MEKKIKLRKDIIGKLIRGNLVLATTKLTTMVLPTLSVVSIVIPQVYVTLFVLLVLSSFAFAINNKEEGKEEC